MNKLYRIRNYRQTVYVEQYTVNYVKLKNRIISNVSEGAFMGIKLARLDQFNQSDKNSYIIISDETKLFRNLNYFLKTYHKVTGKLTNVIEFNFELEEVLETC